MILSGKSVCNRPEGWLAAANIAADLDLNCRLCCGRRLHAFSHAGGEYDDILDGLVSAQNVNVASRDMRACCSAVARIGRGFPQVCRQFAKTSKSSMHGGVIPGVSCRISVASGLACCRTHAGFSLKGRNERYKPR
ncbi:MAG TPA: hypothetical protein VGN04_15860 [Herbaspirillum sp.]|jgi:hypothetical protein